MDEKREREEGPPKACSVRVERGSAKAGSTTHRARLPSLYYQCVSGLASLIFKREFSIPGWGGRGMHGQRQKREGLCFVVAAAAFFLHPRCCCCCCCFGRGPISLPSNSERERERARERERESIRQKLSLSFLPNASPPPSTDQGRLRRSGLHYGLRHSQDGHNFGFGDPIQRG